MLKPKEIERLPDRMIELYAQVEMDILCDAAERISAFGSFIPAAQWQYRKLIEMGNYHSDIVRALASITGETEAEIKRLMESAGQKALRFDHAVYRQAGLDPPPLAASPALQAVLKAGMENTMGLFDNLTRTTAQTATHQFEHALDRAWLQINSGAFSPQEAVRMAVKDLSRQGVGAIHYPSGHTDSLDVAVRRAVVTGVNQTALKAGQAQAMGMGCDLVEVTAHAGARTGIGVADHSAWQGKVYSMSGDHPKYPSLAEKTGYGTGPGLGGWNCRHSFFPFFEGISEPAYQKSELAELNAPKYEYNGKKLTEYEAAQRQRYLERQIRRWKREKAAMGAAGLDTGEASAKLRQWQATQRDFLEQTGLKRQYDRERIEYNIPVAKPQSHAIIKNIDLDDMQELAYGKQIDSAVIQKIYDTIWPGEQSGEYYISDVFIGSLPSGSAGIPLLQIEPMPAKGAALLRLNINSDVLAGKTEEEVDQLVLMSKATVAESLEEAVIHEIGHAKLIQGMSTDEIRVLYEELGGKSLLGISEAAKRDGVEAIAEIEVLLSRGDPVDKKVMEFYLKYTGGRR